MKKILSLVLVLMLLLSLTACGNSGADDSDPPAEDSGLPADDTVAYTLNHQFNSLLTNDPNRSAQEIAEALLTNPVIPFTGMTMPVEEGLLTGFDNAEITGFEEGVMFGPAISTTPFIGYIFVLKDDTDAEEFTRTLHENANLRWNVCTEADQALSDMFNNKIFFVMAPKEFEEE